LNKVDAPLVDAKLRARNYVLEQKQRMMFEKVTANNAVLFVEPKIANSEEGQ